MKRFFVVNILIILLVLSSCRGSNNLNNGVTIDKYEENNENIENTEVDDSTVAEVPEENDLSDDVLQTDDDTQEESDIVKLIVPEGYTVARIGMRLEDLGVCTVDEFLDASLNGDYSDFPLVAEQGYNENRCYNLEGYLFPDTYEIYRFDSPESIIRKMLANNETKINSELRLKISQKGKSFDEIVTLASIVQKEASERSEYNPEELEMPRVASVLYNRLEIGMMLQCNVTATYVNGVLVEFVEGGFDKYNEYYNTYHCPALPAGAICNPGISAINAAIEPADSDYIFFLTDTDNNFYYSNNYEDHLLLEAEHLGEKD